VNSTYEGQFVGSSRYIQKVNVLKLRNACTLLNSNASLISRLKRNVFVYRNGIVCMRVFFIQTLVQSVSLILKVVVGKCFSL
jgi:hypothetical protein